MCTKSFIGTNKFVFLYEVQDEKGDWTSVLLARPKTGRTHQLRLHLQQLGFPVVSDPNYGKDGNEAREKQTERESKRLKIEYSNEIIGTDEEKATLLCRHCTCGGDKAAFSESQLRYEGICLHAYCYKISLDNNETRVFKTKLPTFIDQEITHISSLGDFSPSQGTNL